MREAVQNPAVGVDEFSPTVAPTSSPEASKSTEAATGVPARSDDTDTLLGVVLADRYSIDRRLGAGGMGAVYVGTHLALAKKVAIKVIQPRLGADATILQRFSQEARAASAIGHENIVQVTDVGTTPDGGSFLVMEYLDGEDLSETLRRDGPLPWHRVIHLGEQIAWALAAAHKHGIVHRDIKPANCYRVPREHNADFIKVLDFGLAKVTVDDRKDGESLTNTGMLLGTPGYIAPELYRGLKADHRVDIYALGALMHKLLTGELPPMCGSDESEPLRGLPAPDAVAVVLGKALREHPDQRHATAQELALALRAIPRVGSDEPTLVQHTSSSPVTTIPRGSEGGRREPSSVAMLSTREPTPVSFSSLVTVERDGSRVRLSLGIPAILLLCGLIGGLVYVLTRRDPIDQAVASAMSDVPSTPPTSPPPVAAPPPPPSVPDPVPIPPVAPPEPAAPPQTTPTEPATPPPPTTTPVADPPTPPAKALPKGTTTRLGQAITRKCMKGSTITSFYKLTMSWTTDAIGAIRSVTLADDQPQPVPAGVRDCAIETVQATHYAWDPDTRYNNKSLSVGEPPAPPAG